MFAGLVFQVRAITQVYKLSSGNIFQARYSSSKKISFHFLFAYICFIEMLLCLSLSNMILTV